MSNLLDNPAVRELLGGDFSSMLDAIFKHMTIAEELIAERRGGKTEPDKTDPIWRSFKLLRATDDLMATEFVYRAHCKEILDRVERGEDTRPATDTEIVCAISHASQEAPTQAWAVGLMGRLFTRIFPTQAGAIDLDVAHYEALYGPAMDREERDLRKKGSQDWRVLDAN